MAVRGMTVEHPYGAIKSWMGATHFKMRRLRNVATEMALHVLVYNMTRVMNLMGIPAMTAAMKAYSASFAFNLAPKRQDVPDAAPTTPTIHQISRVEGFALKSR